MGEEEMRGGGTKPNEIKHLKNNCIKFFLQSSLANNKHCILNLLFYMI
jgi:hypothetical protein